MSRERRRVPSHGSKNEAEIINPLVCDRWGVRCGYEWWGEAWRRDYGGWRLRSVLVKVPPPHHQVTTTTTTTTARRTEGSKACPMSRSINIVKKFFPSAQSKVWRAEIAATRECACAWGRGVRVGRSRAHRERHMYTTRTHRK